MKIVEVRWNDMYEAQIEGWRTAKELQEEDFTDGVVCRTIGILLGETPEVLVIAQSDQPDEEEPRYTGIAVVPRSLMKGEMVILKDD